VVFEEDHDRLWRSLLAYTGDREVASEAAAESFAQALRRGDALHDPRAWVWRTAFRVAGGLLAGHRNERGGVTDEMASREALPDQVVVLLDALDRLAPLDRRVVVLSLVSGLSSAEIGDVVGATAATVRVRLHRARARLRVALANDGLPESTTRGPRDL
jgi:RNA polymerase sigma-70 factor (ECF subfamily)